MPTNPLWVEHTERAAWDTVQSLRDEIQRERRRLEQLMQLQPLLPKVKAALDAAAGEHAISETDPVAIVEALSDRARPAETPSPPPAPPPTREPPPERRTVRADNLSHPVRWFARMLEREHRAAGRGDAGPDPAERGRLVEELERRIAALPGAAPRELFETAVEIGSLALRLARVARRTEDR